jgi:hypothetical protein
MKITLAIIVFIAAFLFHNCYTVVDSKTIVPNNKSNKNNYYNINQIHDICIIEGTVNYGVPINTRETRYGRGFFLENYKWLITPPKYKAAYVYVKGNLNLSYINKRVRIKGLYQTYNAISNIDYTRLIIIIADTIYLLE